jgi:integrase
VRFLRAHRKQQVAARLAAGAEYEVNDLAFERGDGAALHPDSVSAMFERRSKAAGLPPISFHDLRHTYATIALQAGEHPKVVQERLGHASIAVTLDTYSHVAPTLHREAAGRVAAVVLGDPF